MTQIDDIEAIHTYLLNAPSKTTAAETIRMQALSAYEKAGFWDKNMSSDWFDQFRTKRNEFNIANAVTAADKQAVTNTLTYGMTAEEQAGKPRPQVNVKTGAVGSANKGPVPLSAEGQPVLARVLKKGMNGDDVKTWQTFLGLTPATGYFDSLTDSKTRAFQKSHQLTVDGAVGGKTWLKAFPIAASPQMAPSDVSDTAFAPGPAAPQFAPTPGRPAPRAQTQSAAPKASKAAEPPAAQPSAKVITAGLDPSKWSTGAKVIGALAAVSLAGGALMKHNEKAHGHR